MAKADGLEVLRYARLVCQSYYQILGDRVPKTMCQKADIHMEPKRADFKRIGRTCLERGFDPEAYVDFCIGRIWKGSKGVLPKDLDNEKLYSLFSQVSQSGQHVVGYADEYNVHLTTLARWCNNNSNDLECIERILLAPLLPFSAWFRVMYVQPTPTSIMTKYGDTAARELANSPQLRKFVADKAPGMLRDLDPSESAVAAWGGWNAVAT